MTVFSFSYNFSVGLGNLKTCHFQVEKKKIFPPRCVIWRFSFWGLYCFFKLLEVIRSALHSAELRWAQVPREAQHHPGKCEPMPSISTALYKARAHKNGQWREEDKAKRKKKNLQEGYFAFLQTKLTVKLHQACRPSLSVSAMWLGERWVGGRDQKQASVVPFLSGLGRNRGHSTNSVKQLSCSISCRDVPFTKPSVGTRREQPLKTQGKWKGRSWFRSCLSHSPA